MRLVLSALVMAVGACGCQTTPDRPGSIVLHICHGNQVEMEMRVDGVCAVVYTTTAGWPNRVPHPSYRLPVDGERFRLLWCRLRQLPPPTAAESGSYRITLENNGALVAEFVFDDDAERYPLWHGVLRELQVAARADAALALAYRSIAARFAEEGKWLAASELCMTALRAIEVGWHVQFAAKPRRSIDDLEVYTSKLRSLWIAGRHEEAVG